MFTANSTPWRSAAAPNRILTHDPKRNHVHLKFRNPKERQQGRPSSDLGGSPFVLCASAAKSLENDPIHNSTEQAGQDPPRQVHRLVVNRDPKFTNFVEFRTHKVIYRRYAGLFFSLCVDMTDNELAYLECIHLFVEILDHFFSNVCELDLVFNFHKVYLILDEFILAGELQETSKKAIIERMGELEKQE
ncbi:AP-2 complex subunit sigma [Vitis vinifera]|uniref:AP-2 complex subunit sigma n=1 Tax=Vitis vinifera TaxID=29760 RepID=A0A438E4G1_VITVI|nr:AP-2 complex subunit sigma [Vitis vinifera]